MRKGRKYYFSMKSVIFHLIVFLSFMFWPPFTSAQNGMFQNQNSPKDTVLSLGSEVMFMTKGQVTTLPYSITGADSLKIIWTSGDDSIASVSGDGVIFAVNYGSCTISASYCSKEQAQCVVIVGNVSNSSDGYEYVDLGLPSGTLWATTNIGAASPEESGSYFQMGVDRVPDYAYTNLGLNWCIPSISQFEELFDSRYSICRMLSFNRVKGMLVTGREKDNSIFLPGASFYYDSIKTDTLSLICYWTSTQVDSARMAYMISTYSSDAALSDTLGSCYRLPVRPVYEGMRSNESIIVSPTQLDFGSVTIGKSCTLFFKIHNNTFENLEILPLSIDNEEFSIDWTGGVIAPNTSQRVSVTYTPSKLSYATGSSFCISTQSDSFFVNITASSHKSGSELSTSQNLVLWFNDGTKSTYILNDEPVVTIDNGMVKIDSKSISAEYEYKDVMKMTYEGDPTVVDNISSNNQDPFVFTQDTLSFFSDKEDLRVDIISITGITVYEFTTEKGRRVSLSLNQLDSGVYVINVNNNSFKILVR